MIMIQLVLPIFVVLLPLKIIVIFCNFSSRVFDGSNQVAEAYNHITMQHSSWICLIHFEGLWSICASSGSLKSTKKEPKIPLSQPGQSRANHKQLYSYLNTNHLFSLSFTSPRILNYMYKAPGAHSRTQMQPTTLPMLPYFPQDGSRL